MSDLPYGDRTDFENAERGRIDALDPCVVRAADGRVVWDLTPYAYLDGERPDTVHPSLWRQAQASADLTLTLTKAQLPGVLAGHGLDGIEHTGDPAVLGRLTALLDTADPAFPIVTP